MMNKQTPCIQKPTTQPATHPPISSTRCCCSHNTKESKNQNTAPRSVQHAVMTVENSSPPQSSSDNPSSAANNDDRVESEAAAAAASAAAAANDTNTTSAVPSFTSGMCHPVCGVGGQLRLAPWFRPQPSVVTHSVGLRVMNSLTRTKDEFVTMDGSNRLTWYMYVALSLPCLALPCVEFVVTTEVASLANQCAPSSPSPHLTLSWSSSSWSSPKTPPSLTPLLPPCDFVLFFFFFFFSATATLFLVSVPHFSLFLVHPIIFRCGPTVYAPSHMGHARTYLGFDIIRRILTYFQYHITLIVNVTDLDDKIIERSSEQNIHHLQLSQKFEAEFFQDMADLNVLTPTIVTRVTEYMDEITLYIGRIIQRKLAYESNGSVYFDVQAFEAIQPYCKLAPEQIHNAALLQEGEGKLTQDFVSDKRSPRDFALWKRGKVGEPTWDSPWGPGRPGWHIECSVMASDVLLKLTGQPCMDIHSGGVDLKFPHHDNEMAQAEAECGSRQWVNYFVHAGHLHIKGLKMSKSLKNFITIQQALEINSARQIRILFLLHKYNAPMDYGDNTMSRAVQHEKAFVEFFHNAKAFLRQHPMSAPQKWSADAIALQKKLSDVQMAVDDALKDDFDTPTAIAFLMELVKATNVYMELPSPPDAPLVGAVVLNVATYLTRTFQVFGLVGSADGIGFGEGGDAASSSSPSGSREQILAPVLDAVQSFRTIVRDKARQNDASGVLQQCDIFRDQQMPPLGIRLEDKAEGSVWKLADPAELLLEQQQREAEAERKAEEKARRDAEEAKKQALNKLSPDEYLKQLTLDDGSTLMYSQFDSSTGLPTHDGAGEPLNKNQLKKAAKLQQTQSIKYEKYLKSQEGS